MATKKRRAERAAKWRAWYQKKHGVSPRTCPRRDALAKGKRTYIGKLCPREHDGGNGATPGSRRYAISGCCIECVKALSARRLTKAGRAHVRKLDRARERRKTLALKTCIALGISI
jgi:hypothetical protein